MPKKTQKRSKTYQNSHKGQKTQRREPKNKNIKKHKFSQKKRKTEKKKKKKKHQKKHLPKTPAPSDATHPLSQPVFATRSRLFRRGLVPRGAGGCAGRGGPREEGSWGREVGDGFRAFSVVVGWFGRYRAGKTQPCKQMGENELEWMSVTSGN